MSNSIVNPRFTLLLAAAFSLAAMQAANAQTITTGQPATTFVPGKSSTTAQAAMDAEREQIWNSPDMLRARAWLKDYCSKSAKVTPELAKEYETELANMTPKQMKI